MPVPAPTPAESLADYPKAPLLKIDAKGQPSPLYIAWAQGLAALQMAASLQTIADKFMNASKP